MLNNCSTKKNKRQQRKGKERKVNKYIMKKDFKEVTVFDMLVTNDLKKLINNGEILTRETYKYGRIKATYKVERFRANHKDYTTQNYKFYDNNILIFKTSDTNTARDFLKDAFTNNL